MKSEYREENGIIFYLNCYANLNKKEEFTIDAFKKWWISKVGKKVEVSECRYMLECILEGANHLPKSKISIIDQPYRFTLGGRKVENQGIDVMSRRVFPIIKVFESVSYKKASAEKRENDDKLEPSVNIEP
jgi:hypothetical protein